MLVALGWLTGCRRNPDTQAGAGIANAWFEEIGARAGVGFVHSSGHATRYYLPEIMGGGAALFATHDADLVTSLADRSTGTIVAITFWESEDAMRASDEKVTSVRKDVADAVAVRSQPTPEYYEVIIQAS